MSGLLPHFQMPWMKPVDRAISDCEDLGYANFVTGATGSGKTRFCTHLQTIRKHRPGSAHYYLLNPISNPVTALQAVSDSISCQTMTHDGAVDSAGALQKGWSSSRELGSVTRSTIEKIRASNISLLILDRVDRVCVPFLPALFQILETLRTTEHRFGLVLTADQPPSLWKNRGAGHLTYVYNYFHIPPLSPMTCGAVLGKWCPGAEELAGGLKNGDEPSIAIAKSIHAATRGNFRDLEQLAHRKNRHFGSEPFSLALIKELQKELPPRFESDATSHQFEFEF